MGPVNDDSDTATHFERCVERLRSGGSDARVLARELAAELTDGELLGLLDGDTSLLAGLRDFGRHGYNHEPIVAGQLERLGIPGIRFTDGPRGIVMGSSTSFPVPMARGATWDVDLEAEVGRAIGTEARAQGANLFAGVCVNILRHPRWGRAQETYGEDPVHLGVMGAAVTGGVREHVMACVKHFALNSIEDARFQVDVSVDDDVLHEAYLPQFRAVVDAGADAVMSAYNSVNGRWCGDDPTLLTEILRNEWGFGGVVLSDFLFGLRDPVGSVAAGLDVEMPFVQQRAEVLPEALRDGSLRRSDAVEAARRLIATQLRWAARVTEPVPPIDVVASESHRALARRVAAQSMTLVRNEPIAGRRVLPIDPTTKQRLAVIGSKAGARNLGDTGSSMVTPPEHVTLLDGLTSALGADVVVADDGDDTGAAERLARTSDVAIVVVGFGPDDEGEALLSMDKSTIQLLPKPMGSRRLAGLTSKLLTSATRRLSSSAGDRDSMTLSDADEELIRAVAAVNPRTVVVVVGGSAVITESWRHDVAAILFAWYPGMEGGHALADVVLGHREPGGRLPFAIPTDEAHLPHFDPDATEITYDRWWGQRRFDRDDRTPAFSLGYGLGYTSFEIESVAVTSLDTASLSGRARVTVRNVGERDGSTVVQLYVCGDAGPERPVRQLVGFGRASVGPGNSTDIDIELTLRPIARRDRHDHSWSIVDADYRLEAAQFAGDPAAQTALLRFD